MKTKLLSILLLVVALLWMAAAADAEPPRGYSIPIVDLSGDASRRVIVDREPGQYLGHPTTVLLEDGRTMIAVYPKGHGRGPIVMKRSTDGGLTWSERLPVPDNWATSQEVPTIYRVVDPRDGAKRLIMFSGLYPIRMAVSEDDGAEWSPLEPIGDFGGIVAMSCLVRLEDGTYLAMFHDDGRFFSNGGSSTGTFTLYQTRSRDGGLTWSAPEAIHGDDAVHLCEPGLIRSPDGRHMAILLRENSRRRNSYVMFSDDEGSTWSVPRELPGALTGDRHVGRYTPDGRLFISFRDTTYESPTKGDWVAWVGTWDDIVEGREGQYRVRLMNNHVRSDCAYPAIEVLSDDTFVCTTYGHWDEGEQPYIVSVRFTMDELDARAGDDGSAAPDAKLRIADMIDIDRIKEILGTGWRQNTPLFVESVDRPEDLPAEQRANAASLIKLYKARGVEAFGSVNFEKPGEPSNALDVRVFRFATPEQAEQWRNAAYESERGRAQYDGFHLPDRIMYESKRRPKIVLFQDDMWVTVGHGGEDTLHLTVLEECVKLPEHADAAD